MAERKLATTARIVSITSIEGADAIETARVRGWDVVVGKGQYSPGDLVVFFEIDTALPLSNPAFTKFGERSKKTLPDGTEAHVLRTIKLRGQISQGLIMSIVELQLPDDVTTILGNDEDVDLTDILNLQKWEPPVPGGSSPAKGTFLTQYASKTDSERVQNINDRTWAEIQEREWIATEKVDGSSLTMIKDVDGNPRVCSRNWEVSEGGVHFTTAHKTGFFDLMPNGMVVQGEIVGPGVQNNPLKLNETRLLIFDVWQDRKVIPVEDWPEWAKPHAVPIYTELQLPATQDEAVAQADKIKSLVNPAVQAEGIVWHTADGTEVPRLGRSTWKAINNSYLTKQKD